MSTLTTTDLETLLVALGLKTPIPYFPGVDVLNKPLDIARSYLADALSNCVECDPQIAYNSIQWPNNIYNGDLSVILPKLKPGADPDELAFDLMKKVRFMPHLKFVSFRSRTSQRWSYQESFSIRKLFGSSFAVTAQCCSGCD
jgi:hypothetical protein